MRLCAEFGFASLRRLITGLRHEIRSQTLAYFRAGAAASRMSGARSVTICSVKPLRRNLIGQRRTFDIAGAHPKAHGGGIGGDQSQALPERHRHCCPSPFAGHRAYRHWDFRALPQRRWQSDGSMRAQSTRAVRYADSQLPQSPVPKKYRQSLSAKRPILKTTRRVWQSQQFGNNQVRERGNVDIAFGRSNGVVEGRIAPCAAATSAKGNGHQGRQ